MEGQYSGVDILEALESAHNYNDYLTRLIRESAESTDLIDFGAGIGTFSKRLTYGRLQSWNASNRTPLQRRRLEEQGFDTLENMTPVSRTIRRHLFFRLNVFEHIQDDSVALKEIHQKLKPGGALLIYVPAFACLWTRLDEKVCHHRRYTKKTLRRLVEQEGFVIEDARYADCLGFIAVLIFRVLNRSASALNASSIALYDRWVFAPSRVLDKLFDRWFGKNVYVRCRK